MATNVGSGGLHTSGADLQKENLANGKPRVRPVVTVRRSSVCPSAMSRRPVKVIKSEEPAMSIQPKLDSSQAVSAFRRSIHWCTAVSLRDLPFIRKTLISLAVILSISGFTVALAQHQTNARPVRVPAADSQRFYEASFVPDRLIVNKIKARRLTLAGSRCFSR
jgi:hypothetical protein